MAVIIEVEGRRPEIHESAFIAETAVLAGDVRIGANTSVWHGAVLRADINTITVGEYSNVQEGVTIHGSGTRPVVIGSHVTIGHGAVIDDATIGSSCIIGINSTIISAKVGSNCIVGAGAVVSAGKEVQSGTLVVGVPAKELRKCSEEDIKHIRENAEHYFELLKLHKNHSRRI